MGAVRMKKSKSLFLMQLGDTPKLRVLDFLIDNHFFDFPMTAIAKESSVSYNSIKKFFCNLIKSGVIIKTRRIGKSDYYKLNLDNLFVKNLIKIDWILAKADRLDEKELELLAV